MCHSTGYEDLLHGVSALVAEGLLQICGGESSSLNEGRVSSDEWRSTLLAMATSTVHRAKQKQWTLEVRTAPAVFQRFQRNGECTFVSSLGLERRVRTAHELGQLLLVELEELARCDDASRPQEKDMQRSGLWIRAAPRNGMIYVTSPEQVEALRSQGFAACPQCPNWFKGLWWHVQQQHSTSHHEAKDEQAKQSNPYAIVLYHPAALVLGLSDSLATTTTACLGNSSSLPEVELESAATPWDFAKVGDVSGLQKRLATTSSTQAGELNALPSAFAPSTALDDKGAALLHWAAGGGHLPMVRYLVEELRCDAQVRQVSRRSFGGRTPLHWAARNGHLLVVRYLLEECRVDAAAETQDGTNAFGWAAWQGHLDVLQCLHDHDPTLVCSVNRFGCNAVLWAAQGSFEDQPTLVEWLVERGGDWLLVNSNGHSVLHKAAQRGRSDLAREVTRQLFDFLGRHAATATEQDCNAAVGAVDPLISTLEGLVGPDAEGCTPSDLAGMEYHQDLATYLAKQERRFVVQYWRLRGWADPAATARSSCSIGPPAWMDPLANEIVGYGTHHNGEFVWEAGAGASRMRAAVRDEFSSLLRCEASRDG